MTHAGDWDIYITSSYACACAHYTNFKLSYKFRNTACQHEMKYCTIIIEGIYYLF
jgi:hypothetical protein